jgi:hypothetical protein
MHGVAGLRAVMGMIRPENEGPLEKFSWLGPIIGGIITSGVIAMIASPFGRIEAIEKRLQAVEVEKAALSVQIASLKESMTDLKSSQIVLSSKIDTVNSSIQQLSAVVAAQQAARR